VNKHEQAFHRTKTNGSTARTLSAFRDSDLAAEQSQPGGVRVERFETYSPSQGLSLPLTVSPQDTPKASTYPCTILPSQKLPQLLLRRSSHFPFPGPQSIFAVPHDHELRYIAPACKFLHTLPQTAAAFVRVCAISAPEAQEPMKDCVAACMRCGLLACVFWHHGCVLHHG
jgi:hypothetical protein